MGDLIIYIIGYVLAFLLCVFVTRLIFSIPTIVYNLQCQTLILEKLAKKGGVTDEELNQIRGINK